MLDTYIRVTGEDWSRLGDKAENVAHFIGHRAYMRMEDGHCSSLRIEIAPSGEPRFCCGIYPDRPQICRDLQRGSPGCEAERELKSERAKQAVTR